MKWLVYIDSEVSRCVMAGSAAARTCEGEGMTLVWSEAASQFDGWVHAATRYNCIPDDYDDDMKPGVISDPIKLYRSVSIQEMTQILKEGSIQGGGSRFNSFERRPFVFFSSALNDQCIGQAEDVTRIAEYLTAETIRSEGLDIRSDYERCKEIYRGRLQEEKAARAAMSASSCVVETMPIGLGFHYSTETGRTGMNGNDEFGLFPGQVTTEMIERVHLVKDRRVIRVASFDQMSTIIDDLNEERQSRDPSNQMRF